MAAALAALAVLAGCGVMGDPVPPAPKGYYGQR
jgi:predicted small lipoprotein YifL